MIDSEFGSDDVTVVGVKSTSVTGELEVYVQPGGARPHSKLNGDGYIDSEDKLEKIYDAVNAALEAASKKDEKK